MKRKLIFTTLILALVICTSFIYRNHFSKAIESKDQNSFAWNYVGNFANGSSTVYVWVDANNSSLVIKCSSIRNPLHAADFNTASGSYNGALYVTNFIGCGATYTGAITY